MVRRQRRSAMVHPLLLVFGRMNLRGRSQRGLSNRDRRFVFHPHILACLEILVVRHPSFTWNPIHHSAHLPGGAVHLIGPNRTRIGAGGLSIIHTSFGCRPWYGQIHRHQPARGISSVGRIHFSFESLTGVIVVAGAPPRCFPATARSCARRTRHRFAVSIDRPHLSSSRRDASPLRRLAILPACPDSHLPARPLLPTTTRPSGRPRRSFLPTDRLLPTHRRILPVPRVVWRDRLLRSLLRRPSRRTRAGFRCTNSCAQPGRRRLQGSRIPRQISRGNDPICFPGRIRPPSLDDRRTSIASHTTRRAPTLSPADWTRTLPTARPRSVGPTRPIGRSRFASHGRTRPPTTSRRASLVAHQRRITTRIHATDRNRAVPTTRLTRQSRSVQHGRLRRPATGGCDRPSVRLLLVDHRGTGIDTVSLTPALPTSQPPKANPTTRLSLRSSLALNGRLRRPVTERGLVLCPADVGRLGPRCVHVVAWTIRLGCGFTLRLDRYQGTGYRGLGSSAAALVWPGRHPGRSNAPRRRGERRIHHLIRPPGRRDLVSDHCPIGWVGVGGGSPCRTLSPRPTRLARRRRPRGADSHNCPWDAAASDVPLLDRGAPSGAELNDRDGDPSASAPRWAAFRWLSGARPRISSSTPLLSASLGIPPRRRPRDFFVPLLGRPTDAPSPTSVAGWATSPLP